MTGRSAAPDFFLRVAPCLVLFVRQVSGRFMDLTCWCAQRAPGGPGAPDITQISTVWRASRCNGWRDDGPPNGTNFQAVNANLKPRRARDEHVTRISVALEEVPATAKLEKQGKQLAFPSMQVIDAMLEYMDFLPGQQVLFSIDHRRGHITITPDYDYRVAGRYMSAPETEPMLLRRRRRN